MQTIFPYCSDREKILNENGIFPLTGEACNFSMRILCDVNDTGKNLLKDFFGMPDLSLAQNWNSVGNGSIMLLQSMFTDLLVFIFLKNGALGVSLTDDGSLIVSETDEDFKILSDNRMNEGNGALRIQRTYKPMNHPREGSRNVHAMTGRTV